MAVSINPATGEVIADHEEMDDTTVDSIIGAVDTTYRTWRTTTFPERSRLMLILASVLRERKEEYASLMTREMGKLLGEARAEVEKCAWVCEYYAENAEVFLRSEPVSTDASRSHVSYRPLGVVLAVMPWNFPFWQVFRFIAPGLMAGNGCVLKHSSNVFGCALAMEGAVRDAGFPNDLFRTLLVGGGKVDRIIRHPSIRAVTLTGSTPAGSSVAATAGSVLKKCVMELGGSDPYLILDDADLQGYVESCVTSRMLNAGQSCIAAKRFIVLESLRERFESMMMDRMRGYTMGDPTSEGTSLAPMSRSDLRDELHLQVRTSIDQGASLLLGGVVPDMAGAFYPPTILTGVRKGMLAYSEELFGPVATIIPVSDIDEAVAVANDTEFGLGSAVFTSDLELAEHIAEHRLEAGSTFVNDLVRSDPRLPFGGIKGSGFGRELAIHGIREFVNVKTVYIK